MRLKVFGVSQWKDFLVLERRENAISLWGSKVKANFACGAAAICTYLKG